MQRTPTEIDIGKCMPPEGCACSVFQRPLTFSLFCRPLADGHVIHTGAIVQVKWLGIWYEGTVAKIGHKRNLYRVYIQWINIVTYFSVLISW